MTKKNSNAGQPPFFKTPEELQVKIDEYFKTGMRKKTRVIGKGESEKTIEIEVPTICGVALFLGFCSRQSFYDYEKREKFSYTIKRCRLMIEVRYEEMLQEGNATGAIFALKNMGWTDRTEIDQTVKVSEYESMSDDDLEKELNKFDS